VEGTPFPMGKVGRLHSRERIVPESGASTRERKRKLGTRKQKGIRDAMKRKTSIRRNKKKKGGRTFRTRRNLTIKLPWESMRCRILFLWEGKEVASVHKAKNHCPAFDFCGGRGVGEKKD